MKKLEIPSLLVRGDHFAIGRQTGAFFKDSIHTHVLNQDAFSEIYKTWKGTPYLKALESFATRNFPQYMQEIQGIAEGAGVAEDVIFIWNCRGDLRVPDHVDPKAELENLDGCTTLLMPPRTEGGPFTIAHNEDGDDFFHGKCAWVTAEIEGDVGYSAFIYPGMMAGHAFGIGDSGIVQSINNVRALDLKPGIPRHFITRAILNCETLEEAVDLLKRDDRASGFHHALGQKGKPRLLSVETSATKCFVRDVTTTVYGHANHLKEKTFDDVPQVLTDSSDYREKLLSQLLAEPYGKPEDILFKNPNPSLGIYRDNSGGDDYSQTLATAIFDIYNDRVEIAIHVSREDLNTLQVRY